MDNQENDPRLESLQKAIRNTPKMLSVNDLVPVDDGGEDQYIYERRNHERGYC